MMELKELYEKYGELGIKMEILQGQLMNVKKAIAEQLNNKDLVKPEVEVPEPAEE